MISTQDLLTELRIHLGNLSDDELSDDEGKLLLNRAYWELLDKFPFREKEVIATFVTVAGQRNYIAPSPFDALRSLSIQDPTSLKWTPLTKDGLYNFEVDKNDSESARAVPVKYLREGNKIRLDPIPDQEYTLTIKYWSTLDDLETNPTSNPTIPRSWHEIILYGAVWRGFLRLRDYASSREYKIQAVALVDSLPPIESKEEEDSHTIGVEVLGREYP